MLQRVNPGHCNQELHHVSSVCFKEFKRGNRVSFLTRVNDMGYFDSHIWRQVIIPPDLA